jgi:WD40 repeat protein
MTPLPLSRYPACSPSALSIDLCGHSKGTVSCSFSADGQYLYTAGSMDGSVIIWSLETVSPSPAVSKVRSRLGRMSSFDL